MMRIAKRRISTFNFGHPDLSSGFFLRKGGACRFRAHQGMVEGPVAGPIQQTTLNNGVRVVTQDRCGGHTGLGFFVDAGAKYDPVSAPGLSALMKYAIIGGNISDSHFQIEKTLLAMGYSREPTEVRKRHIGWKLEGRNDSWKLVFDNMCNCIAAPRFAEADFERFRDYLDNDLEETRWQNPRRYVVDQLALTAFAKEPLGNPTFLLPESNHCTTDKLLLEHWASYFVPKRIVISAVNLAHDEVVAQYSNSEFQHSAAAPHHERAAPAITSSRDLSERLQYQAGSERYEYENRPGAMLTSPSMENEAIVAVGWPTLGGETTAADYARALVARAAIDQIINDGITYNRHMVHRGLRSFYTPFGSVGLMGFTTRGAKADVLQAVMDAPKLLTEKFGIAAAQQRAIMRLHSEQIEVTRDYIEFLATSPYTEEELMSSIRGVEETEVVNLLAEMRATLPSMFGTGDINGFSMRKLGLRK